MPNDTIVKFVNPYNFIPLQGGIRRSKLEKGNLSGKIVCSLETKTPLFIPNTTKIFEATDVKDHKNEDYYSYEDLRNDDWDVVCSKHPSPVIPGSELRGCIRSVYEIITNSCLSAVEPDKNLTVRTQDPFKDFQPGVLKYNEKTGKWELYKAQRYRVDHDKYKIKADNSGEYLETNGQRYDNLAKIYFKSAVIKTVNDKNYPVTINLCNEIVKGGGSDIKEGYILLNGKEVQNKPKQKHAYVFTATTDKLNLICSDMNETVKKLETILETYRNEKINKNLDNKKEMHRGYRGYELKKDDKKLYPVYYYHVATGYDKTTTLDAPKISVALKGRVPLKNTLRTYLQSYYSPCNDAGKVCPACSLFGFVDASSGKTKEHGNNMLSGRVSFFDAICQTVESEYTIGVKHMKELSGPKITCAEFYLHPIDTYEDYKKNPTSCSWDYDAMFKKTKNAYGKEELTKVSLARNVHPLDINGRKIFLHNKNWNNEAWVEERNNRNITIRPLKTGLKFTFEVAFDSLRDDELNTLIAALNLWENNNNCYHKLGGGKPLGLGSVKIMVDKVLLKQIEVKEESFSYSLIDDTKNRLEQAKTTAEEKTLQTASDFSYTEGLRVCYPIGTAGKETDENYRAGYNFFVNNRGKASQVTFSQVLPSIKVGEKATPMYSNSDMDRKNY